MAEWKRERLGEETLKAYRQGADTVVELVLHQFHRRFAVQLQQRRAIHRATSLLQGPKSARTCQSREKLQNNPFPTVAGPRGLPVSG
jgi:hypothetical protein